MAVLRIGHASIKVMDMEAALHHYTKVIGMDVTMRDKNGHVYLKCWDEWDRYSLILTESDTAGMNHVAYKVEKEEDLEIFQKRIEAWGIRTQFLPEGTLPATGRMLQFQLPSGHDMRLYAMKECVGTEVGSLNPDPWPDSMHGSGAHWMDHILLMCELNPEAGINTVEQNTRFMRECLDFYLTEQVIAPTPDGDMQAATWMAVTTTPHDIAFVGGPTSGLHHIAFFLDSWHDVLKSADIMAKNKVRIDVAPTRHGITRGETIYFFDPSGNRNETFAGLGYMAQRDRPVITWTADNLGTAIFYHTGYLVPSFTEVYT